MRSNHDSVSFYSKKIFARICTSNRGTFILQELSVCVALRPSQFGCLIEAYNKEKSFDTASVLHRIFGQLCARLSAKTASTYHVPRPSSFKLSFPAVYVILDCSLYGP